MKTTTNLLLTLLGSLLLTSQVLAAPLVHTALGNDGEIYEIFAGSLGELLPERNSADRTQSVLVLDVTRPGEETERRLIPTTMGPAVETSPGLIYNRQTATLNIVWESHQSGETSILLARFDGNGLAMTVDEVYFSPTGVSPLMAMTVDELHLDIGEDVSIDTERQILHLAWPEDVEGQMTLGYSPVILLNGTFIGVSETLSLPHLDPGPNDSGNAVLPPTFQVSVKDEDIDRLTLTFGSSASNRITAYEIEVVAMELVHFGELVREYVRSLDGFDPNEIAQFGDSLGVHIIEIGARRNLRSRVLLTPQMIDYVASGTRQWLLDNGTSYSSEDMEQLAADVAEQALGLANSVYLPLPAVGVNSKRLRHIDPKSSTLVIDVSDMVDGEPGTGPSHVLELRFAVEADLPDAGGSEIDLLTSENGQRFLASWMDPDDANVLHYVESGFDGTWGSPRQLRLGDTLSLEQAKALLTQRIR